MWKSDLNREKTQKNKKTNKPSVLGNDEQLMHKTNATNKSGAT